MTACSPLIGSPVPASVVFTAPPPGLSPFVEFDLAEVDGAVGLYTMRDSGGEGVRLFLVDPAFFVPDYTPDVPAEDLSPLGAESLDDVDLYVVATLSDGAPFVNLLAPIVVNPATAAASQVILEADSWPLQAELVAP